MKQSPMFLHAIESFEHGLEHYLDNSKRSRKFALLHVDQAIELFLKEKVVQLGKSIYRNDGTTLNLHEVFRSLKTLNIPEQPRLEELHDLRNVVQHKGLTPDASSTEFYIDTAYRFVKRFLAEELGFQVSDILPKEYRALMEGPLFPVKQSDEIVTIFNQAYEADTPSLKIIQGYTALSRAVDALNDPQEEKLSIRKTLRFAARRQGAEDKLMREKLNLIMRVRNEVVHTDYEPNEEDASNFLCAVKEILILIGCDI